MLTREMWPARAAATLLASCALCACGASEPTGAETLPPEDPMMSETTAPAEPVPVEPQAPPGEPGGPEAEPINPAAPPHGAAPRVTTDEVQAFSAAHIGLLELQQEAARRVQAGEDPGAIEPELERQASEVVQGSGLSVERYEQIARRAAADEELRGRIAAAIEARL